MRCCIEVRTVEEIDLHGMKGSRKGRKSHIKNREIAEAVSFFELFCEVFLPRIIEDKIMYIF